MIDTKNKPSRRIIREGNETYTITNGRKYRVNVYARHAAYLMFQKEFEDLTDEELGKFEGRYL